MTKPTSQELEQAASDYRSDKDFDRGSKHVEISGPTTPISIRLPDRMLEILKEAASCRGIGYQTLLKQWLDDRIRQEVAGSRPNQETEAQALDIARLIVAEAVAGLEERLGDFSQRLASVEGMEDRILDRVAKQTGPET